MTLMDHSKNGAVSLEEFKAYQPHITEDDFKRWDADNTGELEQEELMAAIREVLAPNGG